MENIPAMKSVKGSFLDPEIPENSDKDEPVGYGMSENKLLIILDFWDWRGTPIS